MKNILFRKTFRDLRAQWAQTVALIVIVALGVSSYIALIAAYRDLDTSYTRTYEQLAFADVTFAIDAAPATIADDIAGVPGVTAVSARLIIDTGFELPSGEPIRSRLIGIPPDAQPQVNQVQVVDGRYPTGDDPRGVLLETSFAGIHGIRPGDTITPIINGKTSPLDVVGLVASPEYLIVSPSQQDIFPAPRTFAVLFVPAPTLHKLTRQPDVINNVAVRLDPAMDAVGVITAVQEKLAPHGLETTIRQADQPSNAALQQDLAGYREIANLMPGLILLVAAISVYVMLGRMVRAQQPQIGLMKALGYANRAVLGHYLAFALTIGGLGLLAGISGGIPLAQWITTTYATELGIPLVATQLYPDLIVQAALLTGALLLLAGAGPAWQATRQTPAQAMRFDPSTALVQGRLSPLEKLLPLPLWLRLPWRNVFRMRRRSLSTGLGIVFAFMLVLMVWGIMDSFEHFLDHNFNEVERWDITAVFDEPQTADLVATVAGWEGVRDVVPLVQLPATVHVDGASEDVLITALPAAQEMHVLQMNGISQATALATDQIVLTEALAEALGVQVGDALTVSSLLGEQKLTVGGASDELMSAAAYVSMETAQAQIPLPNDVYNGLYLTVAEAEAAAIKARLYHLPGASSVILKAQMRSDLEELMGLFYAFMGVMMVFVLAMAFALLFNAMTVNVLERQRELATMRALGMENGKIAQQIGLENLILWLLTLVPGLLLGAWMAQQMGAAFSAELFSFDIVVAPRSYAVTAVGILLTMLLAAWPAVRRANRLNLASATKVVG